MFPKLSRHARSGTGQQTDRETERDQLQEENGTAEERDNMLIVIVIYMRVDKKK